MGDTRARHVEIKNQENEMRLKDEGEEYITAIPRLRKWVNECAMCHRKGYRPDILDRISVTEGALDTIFYQKIL